MTQPPAEHRSSPPEPNGGRAASRHDLRPIPQQPPALTGDRKALIQTIIGNSLQAAETSSTDRAATLVAGLLCVLAGNNGVTPSEVINRAVRIPGIRRWTEAHRDGETDACASAIAHMLYDENRRAEDGHKLLLHTAPGHISARRAHSGERRISPPTMCTTDRTTTATPPEPHPRGRPITSVQINDGTGEPQTLEIGTGHGARPPSTHPTAPRATRSGSRQEPALPCAIGRASASTSIAGTPECRLLAPLSPCAHEVGPAADSRPHRTLRYHGTPTNRPCPSHIPAW